tara:strand:+ start:421 stop:717 length:297 start_codon:yes stop_codon:yes gene_type:complete
MQFVTQISHTGLVSLESSRRNESMIDSNISEANQNFNLSLQDACKIAQVDYRTILKHARKNTGVARKVFGRWYINEERLQDLLKGVPAESMEHYDRAS